MPFFHLVSADGWMDVIVFFVHDLFHNVEPIEEKSLNFIQNVARNLKLKFSAIWMKSVKGP